MVLFRVENNHNQTFFVTILTKERLEILFGEFWPFRIKNRVFRLIQIDLKKFNYLKNAQTETKSGQF